MIFPWPRGGARRARRNLLPGRLAQQAWPGLSTRVAQRAPECKFNEIRGKPHHPSRISLALNPGYVRLRTSTETGRNALVRPGSGA